MNYLLQTMATCEYYKNASNNGSIWGLLKLYISPCQELPILCLSTNHNNRCAIALNKTDDSYQWLQTKSIAGVETVFNRLKKIRDSAKIVTASELAQPDTQIIFLQPSNNQLNLEQLRHKLGLAEILTGNEIERATYRDRYLQAPETKILTDLLKISCNSSTKLNILVIENPEDRSASVRKQELESALTNLNNLGIYYRVKVQPKHNKKHFEHARTLEITMQNESKYQIIFDRGLDFIQLD